MSVNIQPKNKEHFIHMFLSEENYEPTLKNGELICKGLICGNCSLKSVCFADFSLNTPLTAKEIKSLKSEMPEYFL